MERRVLRHRGFMEFMYQVQRVDSDDGEVLASELMTERIYFNNLPALIRDREQELDDLYVTLLKTRLATRFPKDVSPAIVVATT